MSIQPLVSVIIPAYNAACYVGEAISSVLAQTFQDFELIVVNDGSTDDTREVLNAFEHQVRIVHQENRGLSEARNRGIGESRGRLISFLDADDVWLPEKLTRQVPTLWDGPGSVDVSHTEVFYYHSSTGNLSRKKTRRPLLSGNCYLNLFRGNNICVSSVLIKRECLSRVGVFDKAIRQPTVQDYDLWMRLSRSFRFGFIAEPLVKYRQHDTNASKNTLQMLVDELYVVRKAVEEDPTVLESLGRREVKERLRQLEFNVGYLKFDAGRLHEARQHFRQAASLGMPGVRLRLLSGLSLLPEPFVRRLLIKSRSHSS